MVGLEIQCNASPLVTSMVPSVFGMFNGNVCVFYCELKCLADLSFDLPGCVTFAVILRTTDKDVWANEFECKFI